MRINTPITQQEYSLNVDTTLMSTTDVNSYITYANSAFIDASGFDESELIGQPHNIVRHPDMPVEAFADMWFTLQQGDSWTGLVKNRRKNGDYYWVRANVTPVYHHEQLSGYISVRNTPSAQEIKAAEPLYSALQKGKAGKRKLYKGLVVRSGLLSPLSLWQKLSVRWRLRSALIAGAIVPLSCAGAGMSPAWLCALTLALFALLDAYLQRQISRPLQQILHQAQDVVSGKKIGHLAVNRVDEIGLLARIVNQFSLNLRSLVNDVSTQVKGMRDVSQQLSESNINLNGRTEETAGSLQQTAAAIEQITGAVEQSSETAVQATGLAERASIAAVKGGEVMQETSGVMNAISGASSKIVDIIGVIDSIAFQTNILALNAAVEAARAGVEGRGFAVVAAEVRNLAQHSAAAAGEIKTLIDANVESVKTGEQMVENATKHIQHIVKEVLDVSALIKEISHAAHEQTAALTLINTSIAHIEEMTQQNAELVTLSSSVAADLQNQAIRLDKAVHVYGKAD
ncbi:PAS domain-containing protein [Affinibrenneria salicis]|uniref:PAS domain-containing protein n=1 Tax=Affinibrenneria salicis TaxID=2590031 RepID=A0A5J5G7Z1_9GAMM|nr:PAS domain-containing methyl-accepting chemotaxis protein [Affinibrenneria salicis]KAA9002500.1 PAS domain-containing protein [Affinibrenneria salicis]KAA9003212.1 PAS domain-containing protein [Affinibrenneria salicis]